MDDLEAKTVRNDKLRVVKFFLDDKFLLWLPHPDTSPAPESTMRTLSWSGLEEVLQTIVIESLEVEPSVVVTPQLIQKMLPLIKAAKRVVLAENSETIDSLEVLQQDNFHAEVLPLVQISLIAQAMSYCLSALGDRHPHDDWSTISKNGIKITPSLSPSWAALTRKETRSLPRRHKRVANDDGDDENDDEMRMMMMMMMIPAPPLLRLPPMPRRTCTNLLDSVL